MSKIAVIGKCLELLAQGIYARPLARPCSELWDLVILHPFGTVREPEDLSFIDCMFYRWEGMGKTVDYPIYGVL